MRLFVISLLVLFSGAPAGPPRTIDITGGDDMKFNATTIKARAGEPLRLRFISTGTIPKVAMAHNVVVLKPATDVTKFIKDGAPFRAADFIPPAMKDAVVAKTPLAGRPRRDRPGRLHRAVEARCLPVRVHVFRPLPGGH